MANLAASAWTVQDRQAAATIDAAYGSDEQAPLIDKALQRNAERLDIEMGLSVEA
jgi:hypothetical protein